MTCNRTRGRRILLINQQERRPLVVSKSCYFFDFSGFDAGCEQNAGIRLFWISFQAYLVFAERWLFPRSALQNNACCQLLPSCKWSNDADFEKCVQQ